MNQKTSKRKSNLIIALREGVAVVQMVLFKELRTRFATQYADRDQSGRSMLAGAVINRLFGVDNPEERFQRFQHDNSGVIEQELLGLGENFPHLQSYITDALRVQTLCDSQEGDDTSLVLVYAETIGVLNKGREMPLPSTFMTIVRELGENHGLTVTPVQVTPEDDSSMVH